MLTVPAALALLTITADFWNVKPPEQWTSEEKQQLLTHSPWAKPSSGAFDLSKTRTGNVNNRRSRGVPGVGVAGAPIGGKIEQMPDMRAIVRWESAEPVRAAVQKPLPEEPTASYVVSVVNMPVNGGDRDAADQSEMAESLKAATWLSMRGKPKWHPFRVVFDGKGAMYFYFDREAGSVTGSTGEITFSCEFGPFAFKAKFSPQEMVFRGKPAF